MEKSSQTSQSPAESQGQALADFGAILLDTFDRLKADKRSLNVWLDFLHVDDLERLALALGKRELAKRA